MPHPSIHPKHSTVVSPFPYQSLFPAFLQRLLQHPHLLPCAQYPGRFHSQALPLKGLGRRGQSRSDQKTKVDGWIFLPRQPPSGRPRPAAMRPNAPKAMCRRVCSFFSLSLSLSLVLSRDLKNKQQLIYGVLAGCFLCSVHSATKIEPQITENKSPSGPADHGAGAAQQNRGTGESVGGRC